MGEDEVEVGSPLVVGDVVLRPIARRRVKEIAGEDGRATLARLRPLGVIVEDGEESRALDLDGEELSDDVLERVEAAAGRN